MRVCAPLTKSTCARHNNAILPPSRSNTYRIYTPCWGINLQISEVDDRDHEGAGYRGESHSYQRAHAKVKSRCNQTEPSPRRAQRACTCTREIHVCTHSQSTNCLFCVCSHLTDAEDRPLWLVHAALRDVRNATRIASGKSKRARKADGAKGHHEKKQRHPPHLQFSAPGISSWGLNSNSKTRQLQQIRS